MTTSLWKEYTEGLWKINYREKSRIKINKAGIAIVYIRSNESLMTVKKDSKERNRSEN